MKEIDHHKNWLFVNNGDVRERKKHIFYLFLVILFLSHFYVHAQLGFPMPWVTWWHGGQLLDNMTDAREANSVSNLLVLSQITRLHLFDAFTCQVTSSTHVPPIMKTITLELNRKYGAINKNTKTKS